VKTPEGKKNAVNFLLPHIQRLPNRIERDSLANDVAQKLGIDSAVLRQEFKSAATHRATTGVRGAALPAITPSEKVLLRALSSSRSEDAGLRRAAAETLLRERLHLGLGTETLFQTLLGNAETAVDAMSLALAGADRATLAAVLMNDEQTLTEELLEGALEALRHRVRASGSANATSGAVEAERNNDAAALLRLKQEKLELDRKRAAEQH
jgi:DNA primase